MGYILSTTLKKSTLTTLDTEKVNPQTNLKQESFI